MVPMYADTHAGVGNDTLVPQSALVYQGHPPGEGRELASLVAEVACGAVQPCCFPSC